MTTVLRERASGPAGVGRLLAGAGVTQTLDHHLARYGSLPTPGAELIRLLDESSLSGRGGASFPTARKLAAVASAGAEPVVVVNGVEGEPASRRTARCSVRHPTSCSTEPSLPQQPWERVK